MTVKELKELLEQYDDDMEVAVNCEREFEIQDTCVCDDIVWLEVWYR